MRIKSLTLKNFKAIGSDPQTIQFAPITLLFGPNSAGKSTVLQALIYLREIFLNRNLNPDFTDLGGESLDLGGFESLVHNHDLGSEISITIALDLTLGNEFWDEGKEETLEALEMPTLFDYFSDLKSLVVTTVLSWDKLNEKAYCSAYKVQVDEDLVLNLESNADGSEINICNINFAHPLLNYDPQDPEPEADDIFNFVSFFVDQIDTDKINFKTFELMGDVTEKRPFIRHKVPELELLLDVSKASTGKTSQRATLKKVQEELSFRKQRSALELGLKVEEALTQLESQPESPESSRLMLDEMEDALPFNMDYLELNQEVWLDDPHEGLAKRKFLQFFLDGLVIGPFKAIRKALEPFTYIGPLRHIPTRQFSARKSTSKSRWSSGLAAWEYLHDAPEKFVMELNKWLGPERLKTGYQVDIKHFRELETTHPLLSYLKQQADDDQQTLVADLIMDLPLKTRVVLRETRTELEVMPQDVGVGISQLLPVVIATMRETYGLVAIEQPELHIHPAIQVEMADLFSKYALGHPARIFLLETHSEHIILRLLRRIREEAEKPLEKQFVDNPEMMRPFTKFSKETVSVQYVESSEDGTKFTNIGIDDDGDFLDEWPDGFFEERDEELFL